MSSREAGRPNKDIATRQILLEKAQELFTTMPYERVSTRLIAKKADVNPAMIRYYFGNKQGLFETMLRETLAPMRKQLQVIINQHSQESFVDLMRVYYTEMAKVPHFPRLITRVMFMSPCDNQRQLLEKVFFDILEPMQLVVFKKLTEHNIFRDGVDPKLCKISYISLMIFPFLAPPALLSMHGIEINDHFLNQLLEHNIDLLNHGVLQVQG
jgi:AcrR family transcriptional regulator